MKVVHCKKEKFDVYIGRPSKWGNPFAIGRDGTRSEVIEKYRQWIQTRPELMNSLSEISGKILGCWCYPNACHGDVLIELAKQKESRKMLRSLDTETTGVDHHHGARAFLVTTADEENEVTFWEADIDPYTRMPLWTDDDLNEIEEAISPENTTGLILQNPRFDVRALSMLRKEFGTNWRWDITYDTLMAGHLLASNQPHDLTSMTLIYCGINIQPLEDEMELHVQEARKLAKSDFPKWRIAKAGDPTMPSAKEKVWKFDMWLPRMLAKELAYPKDHPWWTCTSDYANGDSQVTLPLYKILRKKIIERKLWKIYESRLKLLPVIYKMESVGVHASKSRTLDLEIKLTNESDEYHEECLELADNEIDSLPVNGTSNALKSVVFDKFKLVSPKKTLKGQPAMDKGVLDHWMSELSEQSKPYRFISNLRQYRRRKTALGYIASYEKFWLPTKDKKTMILYPSLNPTGTDTLRFSGSNPNAQQISKQEDVNLRYCFGPGPGREWWSLDAKNIELRLPAYGSEEVELIELFEHPDDPPYYGSTHLLNFHTVYPDLWDDAVSKVGVDKAGPYCKKAYASTYYQWCKNGGFAIQYGAVNIEDPDKWGTADRAFHKKGGHSLLQARFNRLQTLNRRQIDFANKRGYVETMPDRSVDPNRGYPLLCTRSHYGKVLETVPLSYHIQGTAMWWTCRAMVKIQERLDTFNSSSTKGYFMVMQIHDEIVLDFPQGKGSEPWKTNLPRIKGIARLMASTGEDLVPRVPTPVGIEYHSTSWAEGKTLA